MTPPPTGAAATPRPLSVESVHDFDLRGHEEVRCRALAERWLPEPVLTLLDFPPADSPGGPRAYFSEGDYWWPDPENPGGPYIRRDGFSNPDTFQGHRRALRRLSIALPALVAGWVVTGEERYAQRALKHALAWFVDPRTAMEPHLRFGQAIRGITTGRCIGIVDTVHLIEVAVALRALRCGPPQIALGAEEAAAWFGEYMRWLRDDPMGIEERDELNNHGTCWCAQVAAFAKLCDDHGALSELRTRFREVLLDQIAPDGSMPLELARTKPYNYSIFNLDLFAALCQLASVPQDNLWLATRADGRGMRKALDFMAPYLAAPESWPYPADVEYAGALPVRQPSLLFGAIAYGDPSLLETWKRLDPDPTIEEIVRNFPFRQPVLWLDGAAR